jgi:hypothetical protein
MLRLELAARNIDTMKQAIYELTVRGAIRGGLGDFPYP